MNGFARYSLLFCTILVLASFGRIEVAAQNKSAGYLKLKQCIDENETTYNAAKDQEWTVENTARSRAILDTLIGCADNGLKIKSLSPTIKRDLTARRKHYVSEREAGKHIACSSEKMNEIEKVLPDLEKKIAARNRAGVLSLLQSTRIIAVEAKTCIQRALDSPLVSADIKSDLRETMHKVDSMLTSFDNLKQTVESSPQ